MCPAGETGTPPTRVKETTTQQAQCATNNHRHAVGGTCHPDHEPPCGAVKWDPGHVHALVDRPACTSVDASHATGPVTYCGGQSHTHKTRHFHYGGNGCHPVADEHTTRTSYDTCSDWVDALIAAIKTNSSPLPGRPAGRSARSPPPRTRRRRRDRPPNEVLEAKRRMASGELDPNEYIRLHRRNECSKPGHCQ